VVLASIVFVPIASGEGRGTFFVDNPASRRVVEKCGFRDTGRINHLSQLYRGDERPVKVMRLDYAL
jgi:RimJ/RimL family protein N-acetyltransferase